MKKHPKLKSAMATLLAVCMLATFPACSGGGGGENSSTAEGGSSTTAETSSTTDDGGSGSSLDLSNLNEPGTTPVLKEKVPLSVLFVQDTNIEDMETNDYTKKLEEEGNVDTLPDVICMNLTPIETYSYGSQGYFLPMNDLWEEVDYYSKEYWETDGAENMVYVTSPDGNIYGMPRVVEEIGNDYDHRMWIN